MSEHITSSGKYIELCGKVIIKTTYWHIGVKPNLLTKAENWSATLSVVGNAHPTLMS